MIIHLAAFIFDHHPRIKSNAVMFILYIDGSGSVSNPNDEHFVLGGVAIFERQIFHLIEALDQLVDSFGLGAADQIELHGNPTVFGQARTLEIHSSQ